MEVTEEILAHAREAGVRVQHYDSNETKEERLKVGLRILRVVLAPLFNVLTSPVFFRFLLN
jgi:hypothetical protein